MILMCGGEKGGTGKTTLAVNLAVERARQGRDVLLVDSDKQGNATKWAALRMMDGRSPCITSISVYGSTLAEQVRRLAEKYDDVIIDTRGTDSAELRSAMTVANVMVTPTRASQFDLDTLVDMAALVEAARGFNPGLRALLVISQASTHAMSSRARNARLWASDLTQYEVCEHPIKIRDAYVTCTTDGVAVCELDDEKAQWEMKMLSKEVWKEVEVQP